MGQVQRGSDYGRLLRGDHVRLRWHHSRHSAERETQGAKEPRSLRRSRALRRIIPAIAEHCGVSVMTIRRRMKEWTGIDDKLDALELAAEDRWPPKRKNLSE